MKRCRPDQNLRLDVKALIAHLGGTTKTQIMLIQGGFPISRNAIEKWIERQSIPYGRQIQLIDAAEYVLDQTLALEHFTQHP